ncbi:OLC1v1006841C1 [Oldenlandia corymbosa var. corymbosa]|uniref:OLC1v1006841C1 n=1 Tax=Oldenlandia corymbosa var. corymbosa TaxID=529605 RepID=A0AAV1DKC2_OLDCO|nr:OLC1v1006841C1 [Oldenlandia corymbosa var. corymbosa]
MTTVIHQSPSTPYDARDSLSNYSGDDYHLHNQVNYLCSKKGEGTVISGDPTEAEVSRPVKKDGDDGYPHREKGTTALSFVCGGGLMVATDHMDASKAFVENVVDLSSHVLVTVSGNIPNAGSFLRNLQMQYRDYEAAQGKKSVDEASQWVANQMSSRCEEDLSVQLLIAGWDVKNYRDYEAAQGKKSVDEASQWVANQMSSRCEEDLSVQLLIAGWDVKNGPILYCVDGEGNRKQGVIGATGSGSDMVYCYSEDGLFYDMCRFYVGATGWEKAFHNVPVEILPQDILEEVVF